MTSSPFIPFLRLLACVFLSFYPLFPASAAEPGDINGDGNVEPADIFYLLKHLYGYGPAPVGDGDFDKDGALSEKDADALTSILFESAPLATTTLDQRGGVVEADGFRLEVPANTLSAPQQITITSGAAPADFPDATSRRFIIHGLPAELAANIKISLPLIQQTGMLPALAEPDIVDYVVVQGPVMKYSRAAAALGYYFLEAYQAAENVVTEIGNAGRWLGDKIEVFSIRRARLISSQKKFEMMVALDEWPKYREDLTILGNFLDSVHQDISTTMGLPWDLVLSPRIRVIFSSNASKEGEAVSSNWGTYLDYLTISKKYFQESLTPQFMSTLSHEVTHLLTNQWDPRWSQHRRNLADWWYQGNEYLW